MRRKKRPLFLLISVAFLIGLPSWLTNREVRRQHLNAELITAIKDNDAPGAFTLFQTGADGTARDTETQSTSPRDLLVHLWDRLIHRSSTSSNQQQDHPSALHLYYAQYYPEPQQQNSPPQPFLDIAVTDEKFALALIRKGANINMHNAKGETPLLLALASDEEDVVRALLQQGAKVDVQDTAGKTPVWCTRKVTMVKLLLQYGAHIDIPDEEGRTPLGMAAAYGQADTVALLLQQGARIDVRDQEGNTPLMMALQGTDPSTIQLLLKKGADIHARNREGTTALMLAADHCDSDLFRRFLSPGIDVNVSNDGGNTALSIVEQYLQDPEVHAVEHDEYAKKARLLRNLGAKEVKPKQDWTGGELGEL